MNLATLKEENSRLLREDWREKREIFRSLPEIVSFNHANVCTLRCVTCWHHVGVPIQRVALRDVERICHQLLPAAKKIVLTAAGEPLISDFDEITVLARHYRTRIDMYTSGLHLTEDRFRRSFDLLDVLRVSMDCPQKEGYERVRVGSSFDRVLENLKMVKRVVDAEGKPFAYCCSAAILKSTVRFLPEFVRFANDLGFDALQVQRLYKTHPGLEDEDILTKMPRPELDAIIQEALVEAKRANQTLLLGEIGYSDFLADPIPEGESPRLMEFRTDGVCWFVGQSLCINPAGEVTACCFPTDLHLGNALTQPIRKIWNGRAMRRLRRQFHGSRLNVFCRNCPTVVENPLHDEGFALYRRAARLRWFELRKRISGELESALRGGAGG